MLVQDKRRMLTPPFIPSLDEPLTQQNGKFLPDCRLEINCTGQAPGIHRTRA